MPNLVVFGSGDIARLAQFYFSKDTGYEVVGFTVDREFRAGDEFQGLPLVDFDTVVDRFPPATHEMFIAVSYTQMNRIRAAKYQEAKDAGYRLASYLSPRCTWLADAPPGDNCFI